MQAAVVLFALLATTADVGPASRPATDADAPSSQPARAGDVSDDEAPSSRPSHAVSDDEAPSSMPATAVRSPEPAPAPVVVDVPPPPAPLVDDAPSLTAGMVTSRPGATESARLLLRGAGLLSIGVSAEAALGPTLLVEGERLIAPDLTLRYAIFDGIEVRVSTRGEIAAPDDALAFTESGFTALSLGSSVRVLEAGAWYVPDVAILLRVNLPFSTLVVEDTGVLALGMVSWSLLDRVSLSSNLGVAFDGTSDQFTLPYTLQAAFGVGGGFGLYAETFGQVLFDRAPTVWVDGGLFYDVGTLVRVDLSAGLEPLATLDPVDGGGGWFVGVGASVLLPGHLTLFGGDRVR